MSTSKNSHRMTRVFGDHLLLINLRRLPQEAHHTLRTAHRLGYGVVLLTNTPDDRYDPWLVHREVCDLKHLGTVLNTVERLAQRFRIKAVPMLTETSIELSAHAAQHLGLPGFPVAAVPQARSKFAMKQALAEEGDVVPRHARVVEYDAAVTALGQIGCPAVLKPINASGSTGIFEIREPEDLLPAWHALQRLAPPTYDPLTGPARLECILEEFLDGPEVSVEGVVAHGEIHIVGITDKWTTDPFHLEEQHIFPSRRADIDPAAIHEHALRIIRRLGFDTCAFHLEGKWTSRGFRFIEVAARPAGDFIASHLVPASCGIDLYDCVIRAAVGERIRVQPQHQVFTGVRYLLAQQNGRVAGYQGLDSALLHTGINQLFVEQPIGTMVALPPADYRTQRLLAILGSHPGYGSLIDILASACAACTPVIDAEPAR